MSATAPSMLNAWSIAFWPALGLTLSALIYLRGWRVLHRIQPERFPEWRAGAFLGGLAALAVAVASPLDSLSRFLLSAHMVQHLLLMSVAAPLLLLGAPLLPLLRGLPRAAAHDGFGPFLSWPALQRFGHRLTHPVVCWLALIIGLCAWHVPAAFDLALRSPAWHEVEHATFFLGALLFWFPVIRPFPSRPEWPLWTVPLYLLAADLVNSVLCAILAFTEHVIYPAYAAAPRLFGTSALQDQASAGVIMWVPGSVAFLVPATVVAIQFLSAGQKLMLPESSREKARRDPTKRPLQPGTFDVLAIPVLRGFLKSLAARRTARAVTLLLAVAVMVDGFIGPSSTTLNLAGVLPWTYGRTLAVVALLVAGNAFCFACPFMLPREVARRLGLGRRVWPLWLRSKWLAVGLLGTFFWAYEFFALWNSPRATAVLVLSYFAAATAVDALFRGASFCKYVCPIGQFQFITSLVSPLEVKVRETAVCATCTTHDCLRGNATHRGCELDLYLPRKDGNLDCTFCLDCTRACPHENIGVLAVAPASGLRRDPVRSALGRLSRRPDLTMLALLVVFAGFTGAAAMTAPVDHWLAGFDFNAVASGQMLSAVLATTAILIPGAALGLALGLGHLWAGRPLPFPDLACRLGLALVPLGAAMWAAHLSFHLLNGVGSLVPALQRILTEPLPGGVTPADWPGGALRFQPETVLSLQTLVLGIGLLLTLHTGWAIAREVARSPGGAARLLAPWTLLVLTLYGIGLWILLQPMQLRGLVTIPINR